jgi:hypothetical protein
MTKKTNNYDYYYQQPKKQFANRHFLDWLVGYFNTNVTFDCSVSPYKKTPNKNSIVEYSLGFQDRDAQLLANIQRQLGFGYLYRENDSYRLVFERDKHISEILSICWLNRNFSSEREAEFELWFYGFIARNACEIYSDDGFLINIFYPSLGILCYLCCLLLAKKPKLAVVLYVYAVFVYMFNFYWYPQWCRYVTALSLLSEK